jgi:hypothetical protein
MRLRVGVAEQYGKTLLAADSCRRSAAEVLRACSSDALRMTVSLFCVGSCTAYDRRCAVKIAYNLKPQFSNRLYRRSGVRMAVICRTRA